MNATAEAGRNAGMAAVEAGASAQFIENSMLAIRRVAMEQAEFIVDEVWKVLPGDVPQEPRAMGPMMVRAQRAGVIAPTEKFQQSKQVLGKGHMTPRRVWRSLLYKVQ